MAHAGDGFALPARRRREQRARRAEQESAQLTLFQPVQQIPAQHARAAAAARAARVDVLLFRVKDQKPAVVVDRGEVDAAAAELIEHDRLSQLAEVAGHDQVIVRRYAPQIAEVRL